MNFTKDDVYKIRVFTYSQDMDELMLEYNILDNEEEKLRSPTNPQEGNFKKQMTKRKPCLLVENAQETK
jgi:hypothetical protein